LHHSNNRHDTGRQSVAVVLFQLGGPDSPEAIEPFLCNLFSDPDIINFPFARLARPTLARLIASRRAKHVRQHYTRIGGRSPIRELTERQAAALERELRKTIDAQCLVAMRYWHPSTSDAVRLVQARRFDQLVLLPLYPQYSKTTTGSSVNEWRRQYSVTARDLGEARVIPEFYNHSLYIEAVVERINLGLEKFRRAGSPTTGDVYLVFSAHGVPLKEIEEGDPYQAQIESTLRSVMERGRWPNPHWLCYQSRVGPGKWLQPALDSSLHQLALQGADQVLVIPISFVTDHVETLYEIDIEARELAGQLGVRQFEVMPALNDSPTFIRALADLVAKAVGENTSAASD
jgi:protoporphyrin/coproporphyrin ferrochelatase